MMIAKALWLPIFTLTNALSSQVFYEQKDLEFLEKEKNYDEFLAHVNDIRPSQRDRHWREMYQSMSMGLIDYKLQSKDFSFESYKKIQQIANSSTMRNDEFFLVKHSQYVKKYLEECFYKASITTEELKALPAKQQCQAEMSSFWLFSKKDPDLGLELAGIAQKYQATINLWPFYEKAIRDDLANIYCKKPHVQSAAIKKLYEETFQENFNGNYKILVDKLIPMKCFNELVPTFKAALISDKTTGLDKEMAINVLEAKGKLSPDEQDLYALIFLLDGPVVGDKLNLAWSKLENLGESFSKRQKLLSEIQKLPLLPDKIFKDPNLPRHKAIINLFAKNFPEYLNYYGQSCIKFLSNKSEESLNIASSFQCNEFLKGAEAISKTTPVQVTPWVSDTVKSQYSALKK